MTRRSPPLWALLPITVAMIGCGGDPAPNPVRDGFIQASHAVGSESVGLQFASDPKQGVRPYRLPGLVEIPWRFEVEQLTPRLLVGFVPSADLVYLVTDSSRLAAFDLSTGRSRTLDTLISHAVLGPTGTLHTVREDGSVTAMAGRRLERWPDSLEIQPTHVWGATRDRLALVLPTEGGQQLRILSAQSPAETVVLPDGLLAGSQWGDFVVVATDSALVGIRPGEEPVTLRLESPVTGLLVSASGHRVLAGTANRELVVVDRFSFEVLNRHEVDEPVGRMRADPRGRYLLLENASGGSMWILDHAALARETPLPLRRVAGTWADDLPRFAPDGTVLVREGEDVMAYDPESREEMGRVVGGAVDSWLLIAWDASRPTLQLASADAQTELRLDSTGVRYYAQIASSSNEAWAADLVDRLRQGDVSAELIRPADLTERYRVVLGPFDNRADADDAGRRLGRPYFIYIEDAATEPNAAAFPP